MSAHQDILGFVDLGRQGRRPPVVGMQFLHERAMRPRDLFARGSLRKPQDFISFILGHAGRDAPAPAPRVAPPAPAPKSGSASRPSGGGRTHTIAPRESLWSIARKYYGDGVGAAKVNAIYEANRDVMRSPTDLKVGSTLRIP